MSLIEVIAAIFGFLSVWFYIVRNPASWPTGLIQVLLLWAVFWNAKLYADFGLHVLYAILQIYGWWAWHQARRENQPSHSNHDPSLHPATDSPTSELPQMLRTQSIPVRRLPRLGLVGCLIAVSLLTAIFSTLLIQFTDATLPIWDSFIAAASIVAQCLLAARFVENWRFWIAVDIIGIGVFAYKALYPTAILYVLFLGMAIYGDRVWRKSLVRTISTNSQTP